MRANFVRVARLGESSPKKSQFDGPYPHIAHILSDEMHNSQAVIAVQLSQPHENRCRFRSIVSGV
jgi:hypothetical protein